MIRKTTRLRAATLLALAMGAAGGLTFGPPAPGAHAASSSGLQGQISSGQSQISSLSGSLRVTGAQLAQINGNIAALQRQIGAIQSALDADRAKLLALRGELTRARVRLGQLELFQARAEQVLSTQLVSSYETGAPDLISVVLEAKGFSDLLERLSFAKRIRNQDVLITSRVRAARRAVSNQATTLGALELRQQNLAEQVLRSRDSLDRVRIALVRRQLQIAGAHDAQARQLGAARQRVGALRGELAQLQAAEAQRQAAAQRAAQSSSPPAGQSFTPAPTGSSPAGSSGGFTFPLPKGSVTPPSTWTEDQGVDMAAPGNTPEFAVCSGTIVQHGIGGFGPWAPILHCDSSLGGYDYVYYGHAGPEGQLPIGTHVSAGEVMSSVGPGIVGISSGPHIEIGFAGADGAPAGGASTMMSLLQSSY